MKKPKRLAIDEIWVVRGTLEITTDNVEELSYILEGIGFIKKVNYWRGSVLNLYNHSHIKFCMAMVFVSASRIIISRAEEFLFCFVFIVGWFFKSAVGASCFVFGSWT